MLSRYFKTHTVLEKTLKDLDQGLKCLVENVVSSTKELKETLEIMKVGPITLSRRVTVLKSEKFFEFIIEKLSEKTGHNGLLYFRKINQDETKIFVV